MALYLVLTARLFLSACGTYQLFLILHRQGSARERKGNVDFLNILEDIAISLLPLFDEWSGRLILGEHADLLASSLHDFETLLELLGILIGILATDMELDRDFATLERLKVGSYGVVSLTYALRGNRALTLFLCSNYVNGVLGNYEEGRGELVA